MHKNTIIRAIHGAGNIGRELAEKRLKSLEPYNTMKNKIFYKAEGNIIYPDKTMLTWGPFYYNSNKNAINKMEDILNYIVDWCNSKDTSLHISPQNIIKTSEQIVFDIQAWRDENTLQKCNGIIEVELLSFED